MTPSEEISTELKDLAALSPSGFAIGLHLSFTASKYIFQSYAKAWMDEYTRQGFLLKDPTVRWGLSNEGFIRWSDLREQDDAGVIDAAGNFGLKYGVSVSYAEGEDRSLGSFACDTAEFSDEQIADFAARLKRLHGIANGIEAGSPEDARVKRVAAALYEH